MVEIGFLQGRREVIVQPATIPPVPLERPPILNICHWAAPEDGLPNTLHLLGLRDDPY